MWIALACVCACVWIWQSDGERARIRRTTCKAFLYHIPCNNWLVGGQFFLTVHFLPFPHKHTFALPVIREAADSGGSWEQMSPVWTETVKCGERGKAQLSYRRRGEKFCDLSNEHGSTSMYRRELMTQIGRTFERSAEWQWCPASWERDVYCSSYYNRKYMRALTSWHIFVQSWNIQKCYRSHIMRKKNIFYFICKFICIFICLLSG